MKQQKQPGTFALAFAWTRKANGLTDALANASAMSLQMTWQECAVTEVMLVDDSARLACFTRVILARSFLTKSKDGLPCGQGPGDYPLSPLSMLGLLLA